MKIIIQEYQTTLYYIVTFLLQRPSMYICQSQSLFKIMKVQRMSYAHII